MSLQLLQLGASAAVFAKIPDAGSDALLK